MMGVILNGVFCGLVEYSDMGVICLECFCRIGFLSCLGEHGSGVFLFLRVYAELEWFKCNL